MLAANIILIAAGVYLGIGLLVALAFVTVGVGRVDPGVHGPMPLFRLFIVPGSALLWPLIIKRWRAATRSDSSS